MPYTDLQNLSAAEFKRLCGVSHETFQEMVEVLRPEARASRSAGRTKQVECGRSIIGDFRVLARISQSISYCHQLGTARNHSGADSQKSRRFVNQMWQVSATE